jgi:hypothetical protein
VLQYWRFCGKQSVAAAREPQYFFTNPLTRIMVEITYGASRAMYWYATVGRQSPD